jgi:hypothetical protein
MKGPKYTMGTKKANKVENANPGVGAYTANEDFVKPKSKAAKISGTKRGDIVGNDQRQHVGPGQYDSPSKIGKGGPSYTF